MNTSNLLTMFSDNKNYIFNKHAYSFCMDIDASDWVENIHNMPVRVISETRGVCMGHTVFPQWCEENGTIAGGCDNYSFKTKHLSFEPFFNCSLWYKINTISGISLPKKDFIIPDRVYLEKAELIIKKHFEDIAEEIKKLSMEKEFLVGDNNEMWCDFDE